MTAAQRRAARRRADLPEPTSRDTDQIFTWRRQIADATDPRLRRRLTADAWGRLLAAATAPRDAPVPPDGRCGVPPDAPDGDAEADRPRP
jgi:hypothetical protein